MLDLRVISLNLKNKKSTPRVVQSPRKDFTQKALFGVVKRTTFGDA